MRITDNEGFDMFYLRDDDMKKEEDKAKEKDDKKTEKQPVNEADAKKQKRTAEIIKHVLLVLILITSTVSMIFSICSYYSQTGDQKLVFLENVMGKTDMPGGVLIVDTPDEEIATGYSFVNLPPEVVQQNNNDTYNNNNNNVQQETPETTTPAVSETTTAKTAEIININFASRDLLMTLDGIGPAKADAIIEYRIENGAFLTVDELLEVNGIGEKTLEKIRSKITVDY